MQDDVRHSAMALLARREHSRQELYHKLCNKGYDPTACGEVLRQLEEQGLLSDPRYAEAYIRMRANRGYGPERIRHELREKGVAPGVITAGIAQADTDWCELACQVRDKRFGGQAPDDYAERAKQMRFLQYRGFSQEQIQFAAEGVADTE